MKRVTPLLSLLCLLCLASISAADSGAAWGVYGGDTANTRYSSLDKINTGNVQQLKVAWALQLGSVRSQESTPILVGDTLYVTSSFGPKNVFAVDAKTGTVRWRYSPDVPGGIDQFACCDVNNRGVAYANGKVFVGRLDGHMVALDAKTGAELWKTQVVDYTQGSVITSPPTIVKNLVITGFGGGEYGARGSSGPCPAPGSQATTAGRATRGSTAGRPPG
jgi:alcohol dehydrogenase (cytochrome c)